MNRYFMSLLVVVSVIAGLLVFRATKESSTSVLLPSQLIQTQGPIKRIRVGGRVAPDSVNYAVKPSIKLSFSIQDPGSEGPEVPVVYNGLKPDMFAAGRDVIIDGEYKDGVLAAKKLLTQCPSKYEPPVPGKGT